MVFYQLIEGYIDIYTCKSRLPFSRLSIKSSIVKNELSGLRTRRAEK